jgi:hypothetical protein
MKAANRKVIAEKDALARETRADRGRAGQPVPWIRKETVGLGLALTWLSTKPSQTCFASTSLDVAMIARLKSRRLPPQATLHERRNSHSD